MKITVAIPNYNGLEGLKMLLPKIIEHDFYGTYLLDDKSTDQSVSYARSFPKIKVIGGDKNLGPAGNRNRILEADDLGELIWFIDADMDLVTDDIKSVAEKLFTDPRIALVGGQIVTLRGNSLYWNYGYEMHPLRDRMARLYGDWANKFKGNKKVHDFIRKRAIHYFYGLEIEAGNNRERVVEWVAEGNFLVRTDVFRAVAGFDVNMRYHEGHDFGKIIRQLGFIIKYSPEIVTKHLEIDCREGRKPQEWINARRYFYKKHWGTPKDVFSNFFRLGN